MEKSGINRRNFVKGATSAAGLFALPRFSIAKSKQSANGKLNIAFVGVGGKGASSIVPLRNENIVALCDVDMANVEATVTHPWTPKVFGEVLEEINSKGAKWYSDYRKMFEEMADKIDGVVISTPDHMHYPIARSALNLGIHVYCEKPLVHTVEEARWIDAAAKKSGLVTQMGNQGKSNAGQRLVYEWIQAGVIGDVKEIVSWTNRPIWPQGIKAPDHSKAIPVKPDSLDWDVWQGVAPRRAYDPSIHPFNWRGMWDYGCGAIGDMACHIMDVPYWALNLGMPTAISATTTAFNDYSSPSSAMVTFEFPRRGKLSPVTYRWYEGGLIPPIPEGLEASVYDDKGGGTIIYGEHAYIYSDTYGKVVRILPDAKFRAMKSNLPPRTLPRVKGTHQKNWTDGIRGELTPCSDFEYASGLTEMALLGNVAMRAQRRIEYDAKAMKITNVPEANQYLTKEYPDGWILS
ncbi:Gfo/Idh/MocA family protein [Pelagicoccus mobilis]|uniref:Gfo/Idh/MocA family oxidoreductase n=1 Tax=Pelagicoccus mobilis TaxID=415221 RepID=A0A934VS40_9BACT|nr:Gfo/Idh/MocA family oxidoreductase [Pelagicoccus mobilis]MBK1878615.1 Gfo/Idh/MocA family oxidoreductase [Pelagicoccus mobilis]